MTPLDLPSRKNIALAIDGGTHEDYHLIRLYYSWYAGWFYQNRLRMVAKLMTGLRVPKLLDIGTGSGIFIKELLKYADHVTGIDIHKTYHSVEAMLIKENIDLTRVELRQGSILNIPYPDNIFDIVVGVSVLEHFENPRAPLREIRRVLKPRGLLVAGFPARTRLTAALFGALGYRDTEIHPASHMSILTGIEELFETRGTCYYPVEIVPMYVACEARKSL